jgi:hypothetical protein
MVLINNKLKYYDFAFPFFTCLLFYFRVWSCILELEKILASKFSQTADLG